MNIDELMLRLDERQEKMLTAQNEINITLVKQQATLDEHVRRTEANELAVKAMMDEMATLRVDSVTWPFLGKALAAIIPLIGTIFGILKALGKI